MIVYLVNPIKLTRYVHLSTNRTLSHFSIFNPRIKNTCYITFQPKEKGLNIRIEDEAYPGLERMHCQKSLKGPGTVLNGLPSKQAYKFYKTTMCEIQDVKTSLPRTHTHTHKKKTAKKASTAKIKFKGMTSELSIKIGNRNLRKKPSRF